MALGLERMGLKLQPLPLVQLLVGAVDCVGYYKDGDQPGWNRR